MRIRISGEQSLINNLQSDMEKDPESTVERVEKIKDETELHFGIGEILEMVSIVKGIAELVKLLMGLKSKVGAETQKLTLKTALGTTVMEFSKDVTAEELYHQLSTIIHEP